MEKRIYEIGCDDHRHALFLEDIFKVIRRYGLPVTELKDTEPKEEYCKVCDGDRDICLICSKCGRRVGFYNGEFFDCDIKEKPTPQLEPLEEIDYDEGWTRNQRELADKINQIIRHLNALSKK